MLISKARIFNYKSFLDSKDVTLTPGFNIVVGQNDAGKTAFIEALSLTLSNKPHRDPNTVPFAGAAPQAPSRVELTFELSAREHAEVIANHATNAWLPCAHSEESQSAQRYVTLQTQPLTLEVTYEPHINDFVSATLRGFPEASRGQRSRCIHLTFDPKRRCYRPDPGARGEMGGEQTLPLSLAPLLRRRLYAFRAERLNVAESAVGHDAALRPDASNLAQVIQLLQSANPPRFRRFNDLVTQVFPHIRQVTAPPVSNNRARILLWSIDPSTEREDLAVSLADSGTGIGQVLAILYVVVTAPFPQTILIDEPQSFLHPGAIRKLIEILRQDTRHQYIITTHSPAAILTAKPSTLVSAGRSEFETKLTAIDSRDTEHLRTVLLDVGARLSDVFGADEILWVEGKTEETCFPLLLEHFVPGAFVGMQVLGVRHTSDFGRKDVARTLDIYTQLTKGHSLLPRALAFIFDSEGLAADDKTEIRAKSGGAVRFLKRNMYENYLLVPDAIASVIQSASGMAVTSSAVVTWLEANKWNAEYHYGRPPKTSSQAEATFVDVVNGAMLLNGLFCALTANKLVYRKVEHGQLLTQAILASEPAAFEEVAGLFTEIRNEREGTSL